MSDQGGKLYGFFFCNLSWRSENNLSSSLTQFLGKKAMALIGFRCCVTRLNNWLSACHVWSFGNPKKDSTCPGLICPCLVSYKLCPTTQHWKLKNGSFSLSLLWLLSLSCHFLSPSVQLARWAHMHHFLSVVCPLSVSTGPKVVDNNSYLSKYWS